MHELQGVFHGLDIAGSAMRAELQRSEVVAANLANMHVTKTPEGGPYRRKSVVFEELLADSSTQLAGMRGGDRLASGVRVASVYEDTRSQFFEVYDPGHPHANESGYVLMPNVNMFKEMVDLTVIERSFQANLAAMRSYRQMMQTTIRNFG